MVKTRKYKLSYTRKKWIKRDCRELLESCKSLYDISQLRSSLILDKQAVLDDYTNGKISFNQFNKRTNKIDFTISYFSSNLMSVFIEQAIEELEESQNNKCLPSYRYLARFIITPQNVSLIKGYELLQKNGYYNKDNPNGVVKDHRFSIYDGQSLGINPRLLGNIYNCEFLSFKDNLRKGRNSSISLEEFNNLPVSG